MDELDIENWCCLGPKVYDDFLGRSINALAWDIPPLATE